MGLDLAGSLTATGGVGSVLATSKTQTSGYYTRTYLYDGNGNVISLCKPDTGTITANYTYSPFGKLINSGGIDQSIADFTFSTKYADETGLSYYGFRFYSAKLGRCLKRDLIREKGGINIYLFIENRIINYIDKNGLSKSNPWIYRYTFKLQGNGYCNTPSDVGNINRRFFKKENPINKEEIWIMGVEGLFKPKNSIIEFTKLIKDIANEKIKEPAEAILEALKSTSSVRFAKFKWERNIYQWGYQDCVCQCSSTRSFPFYWDCSSIVADKLEYGDWLPTNEMDLITTDDEAMDFIKEWLEKWKDVLEDGKK